MSAQRKLSRHSELWFCRVVILRSSFHIKITLIWYNRLPIIETSNWISFPSCEVEILRNVLDRTTRYRDELLIITDVFCRQNWWAISRHNQNYFFNLKNLFHIDFFRLLSGIQYRIIYWIKRPFFIIIIIIIIFKFGCFSQHESRIFSRFYFQIWIHYMSKRNDRKKRQYTNQYIEVSLISGQMKKHKKEIKKHVLCMIIQTKQWFLISIEIKPSISL